MFQHPLAIHPAISHHREKAAAQTDGWGVFVAGRRNNRRVEKNPKANQVKLAVKEMEISPAFSLLSHRPSSESCRASGAEAGSPSSVLEHR